MLLVGWQPDPASYRRVGRVVCRLSDGSYLCTYQLHHEEQEFVLEQCGYPGLLKCPDCGIFYENPK